MGSQNKLESVKVNIGFPVVQTDGLSGLWDSATRARSVCVELRYQFDERSTNSTFLYCKERFFHTQGENCDKLKLFPWDPGRELFLQLPCRLTIGFCTLCFCFPTKMLHLNAPFFPLKCSVSPKKSLKCSDNIHYTNGFFN